MPDMKAILTANGAAILILFVIVMSSRKSIRHKLFDDKLFNIMIFISMFQAIMEVLSFVFDGKMFPGARALISVINALLFAGSAVFYLMWTIYIDYKLFRSVARLKRIYRFLSIPAILVIIASLVNIFTPVFFDFTDKNVYFRTPLYFVSLLISYAYLIYGIVISYMYKGKTNRYMVLPVLLFILPIFICSFVQTLVYGISLIWFGTAVALVSLYINVQNEISYTDELSGLFSRKYMMRYLDSEVSRSNQQKIISGIMLDIDNFKSINDRYGHLMGDDAIASMGNILRSAVGNSGIAIRLAGDEFIVLCYDAENDISNEIADRIAQFADDFNKTTKQPYRLDYSHGTSRLLPGIDTTDSFLGRLDAAMYKEKNLRKALTKNKD